MLLTKQFYDSSDTNHPDITKIDSTWCNSPSNKYSTSKWKRLVIDLYNSGYSIRVKEVKSTMSKYIYIAGSEKAIVVRVSNHRVGIPSNHRTRIKFNQKFGGVGLIVGVNGVSAKDAFYLIKETV